MSARAAGALTLAAAATALAGCGGSSASTGSTASSAPASTTRVEIVASPSSRNGFNPEAVYKQTSPSVVTILSVFKASGSGGILGGGGGEAGQGSGFVVSSSGEIATNAHVVTMGQGASIRKADQVYVKFADGNEVSANVVGFDPNADVALLKIDPAGLTLRPLALGHVAGIKVGEPVAAIGSPFGEAQSLSIGVISATGRSIDSLTGFSISGALQTDAAINHGNSGGPLLDATGAVLGINSQIKSSSGGGEGVGFAVPVDVVSRSLAQLRAHGKVSYAFLGVSTAEDYPQLAQHFKLGAKHGAWVQTVSPGGPAAKAGLRASSGKAERFQAQPYRPGGDVIVAVAGKPITGPDELGHLLTAYRPGQRVAVRIFRGGAPRTVQVTLGSRPADTTP
jgi:S1-C subfamily serine protease